MGIPEISFTENRLPLKLSVTLNNSPCEPCTVNTGSADPDPNTVNVDPDTVPFELDIDARDADTFCVIETDPVTRTLPVMSNEADGDNFPIPTLPTLSITNGDASGLVSSSTKNELNEDVLLTCRDADGVNKLVPIAKPTVVKAMEEVLLFSHANKGRFRICPTAAD
jgi:hypothetical protein